MPFSGEFTFPARSSSSAPAAPRSSAPATVQARPLAPPASCYPQPAAVDFSTRIRFLEDEEAEARGAILRYEVACRDVLLRNQISAQQVLAQADSSSVNSPEQTPTAVASTFSDSQSVGAASAPSFVSGVPNSGGSAKSGGAAAPAASAASASAGKTFGYDDPGQRLKKVILNLKSAIFVLTERLKAAWGPSPVSPAGYNSPEEAG
jgi:hypothetical protein